MKSPIQFLFKAVAMFGVLIVASGSIHAASLLGLNSGNGGTIESKITVGFAVPGGGSDTVTDGSNLFGVEPFAPAAPPAVIPPHFELVHGPVTHTIPGTDNIAEATTTTTFDFGAPFGAAASDVLSFNAEGNLNAITAMVTGVEADAFVSTQSSFSFFVDDILVRPDDVAGSIDLEGIRILISDSTPDHEFYETAGIQVREDVFTTDTLLVDLVGSSSGPVPGVSVPVRAGHHYTILFEYGATVPFGSDPPFSLGTVIGLSGLPSPAVPEPSETVLMVLGLGAIVVLLGRRRNRAVSV